MASLLLLISATVACGDTREQEQERARRARQMRDVSRMLDAMEASDPAALALVLEPTSPEPPRVARRADSSRKQAEAVTASWANTYWAWIAAGGAGTGALSLWVLALMRRRTETKPEANPPSIAIHFAEPRPTPPPAPSSVTAPEWVYRSSTFETPDLEVIAEPVDLLVPSAAVTPAQNCLRDRLAAADPGARIHLIGDEFFPDIRCVGNAEDVLQAWQGILDATSQAHDNDGRLARWLLPALCVLRARALPKREAEGLFDTAERQAGDALERATGDELAHGFARWIRMRLARTARLSGATRLFALRDLVARLADDPRCEGPHALDACIDVQLAWASWLFGDAAAARLAVAELACDRLADLGSDASTRALRRRGEIALQRARMHKPSARLPDLETAQALLDHAHDRLPCAETALLVARTALQRTPLLPATDATTACSHALLHAFLAEQDPAWRIEALACRLDIQLIYEGLSGSAPEDGIAAALGRDLEAAGHLADTRSTH